MLTMRYTETLIYYDGILSFVGKIPEGMSFLCIEVEDSPQVFLCVPVSFKQLRKDMDYWSLFQHPAIKEWYTAHIGDWEEDIELQPTNRDEIPDDWFPGKEPE